MGAPVFILNSFRISHTYVSHNILCIPHSTQAHLHHSTDFFQLHLWYPNNTVTRMLSRGRGRRQWEQWDNSPGEYSRREEGTLKRLSRFCDLSVAQPCFLSPRKQIQLQVLIKNLNGTNASVGSWSP